ncbi:hypothetical protein SLA2020_517170 [Shorea laevis]
MVLSTALFGKPAFRNLICNGLVLAEDGKKMSKSLKNYPSPLEVIDNYGADALRLYLINSPVVRAEPLRFKKEGVHGVVRDVFLPWYNAYRFLVQNAKRLEVEGLASFIPIDQATLQNSSNVLDQWINSATQSLVYLSAKRWMAIAFTRLAVNHVFQWILSSWNKFKIRTRETIECSRFLVLL